MEVVSDDFRVAINGRKSNQQLGITSSQPKTKGGKKLRADEILITPSTNIKPIGIATSQLRAFQNRVVVEKLGIGLEDDGAFAAGKDEARLGESVLPGVGDVLLCTQNLHSELFR